VACPWARIDLHSDCGDHTDLTDHADQREARNGLSLGVRKLASALSIQQSGSSPTPQPNQMASNSSGSFTRSNR
jgi:hypothetical protein